MHQGISSRVVWILGVAALAAIPKVVARPSDTAPPNAPADVSWDATQGTLRLRYHGAPILEAKVTVEDKGGTTTQAGMGLEPKETLGETVEQRWLFRLVEPKEGLGLVLRATVFGSGEAFPAETLSEAQRRFPLVRNSVGLSRNLRNNAVYDRHGDWVLFGPGDGKTRILPERSGNGRTSFSLESHGDTIELVFQPRYYQKHLGFERYEPWTYGIWKGSLTGYCTWWAYRHGFTQDVLDAMLKVFVEKRLPDFGYQYMQFDDCYQQGNGSSPRNWLNWDERKYPGGWKYALDAIRAVGMKPGIWVHRVHRPSDPGVKEIIEAHPDWFVPGADGKPHQQNGFCSLNTTNEEAVEHMIRALYRGLAEQGWEYVKIDGTGDLLRAYQNETCADFFRNHSTTPEESLRTWDNVAREELGRDVYILACHTVGNARHVIGLVDGARLSNDGFQPRTLAQYSFLEGVVWRNDPDHCDVLGEWLMDTDARMPVFGLKELVLARTIIRPAICAMAGGVLMVSDKVEVYQDDRNIEGMKRSAPVLFTVPGQLYSCGRQAAPWWLQEIDRPFDHWSVLARIQWGEKRETEWVFDFKGVPEQEVRFADLGLPDDREYLVFEFWSQTFLGKSKGSFTAPAMDDNTGMQVFAIREARKHPWILSTTRHLSQGGVSILDARWEVETRTLSGKSALVVGDPTVLTVYVPEGFRLESAEVDGERAPFLAEKQTARVRVVPSATRTVEWTMTFSGGPSATEESTASLGERQPLDLGDVVYATGLGVRAGSKLTYDVSQLEGRFEAWVGIDPKVSAERSGRFRVHADGDVVFDSGKIDQAAKRGSTQNPTRPIRVVVPLAGVQKLDLTFEPEDDKDPATLCGGWGDARLVPASAPEYTRGEYDGTTLARTPPMGWNSWCRYGTEIDETLIQDVADAMVQSGMRDAGYVYVNLDDGWQAPGAKFDEEGYPLWDTEKFPRGMKALGDYLHARGLRYGIYSRAGWVQGHETQFAEKFAEWGVDLVKYDFSNKEQQKATLDAIRAVGRPVIFSVCEWGRERPWLWAPGLNAEMWRTTYDVKDKWTSTYDNNGGIGVLRSAHQNEALGPFVGPGRWNDLDMLQVGVDGLDYGHDRKKAGFDITPNEERFQMSLWSILASPLLTANDVTAMDDQTKATLLNEQVIAVNQDPLGVPGWRVKKLDKIEVWKRPLKNGDVAVVFVNLDDKPRDVDVTWAQLNVRGPWEVADLWEQRSLGKQDALLKFEAVPSHGVVFVRLSQ